MHQSLGGLGTRENITAIDFTGAVPVCELRTTSLYAWTGIHPQFHTYGLGDKHGLVHEYMRILCDPVVIHRMYGVREWYAWFGSRIEANTMRRSGGTLEVRSLRNNYEDVASTTIRQEWLARPTVESLSFCEILYRLTVLSDPTIQRITEILRVVSVDESNKVSARIAKGHQWRDVEIKRVFEEN